MMRFGAFAGLLLLGMALASCGGPAPPVVVQKDRRIHALFVGIDIYLYSAAAGFPDLKGAVGDARRFKQALADLYGVDVDKAERGRCETANAITTTLTDGCATRQRILAVLEARIAALKPGDTLIFYFAGHGSQYRDDEAFDQDSGYNGTILPTDARNPDGSAGDIFDVELKALKDRATAAGIYFVTIFDSCNSATATRDVARQARSVPSLAGAAPPAVPAGAQAGPGGGYWVHLAAAQDGEEAQEVASGTVGRRAGVFTSALIETLAMPGMRDATFGDIIGEVRLRVGRQGHVTQNPSAEGELTAAIGSRSRSPLLFAATVKGGAISLEAGALSGITPGSRFALYASQRDAVAGQGRLATAVIAAAGPASARLTPEGAANLPATIVAEEIAHVFPADLITVSNDLPPGPARDAAGAALRGLGFVSVVPHGATHIVPGDGGAVALAADDGTRLADVLGRAGDAGFGDRLGSALRKIARVEQLLALRTTAQSSVATCIDVEGYRASACPALQAGGVRRIAHDARISATLINRSTRPLHVYLLAIDPNNAVDLILPRQGEVDAKLVPNQPYRRSQMSFDTPGRYRFVTIATDQPIRAEAFRQSGSGARGLTACVSPLERLICAASEGQRDLSAGAIGDWSATVSTALVGTEEPER